MDSAMNWITWGRWGDPIKKIELQIKELNDQYHGIRNDLLRLNDDIRAQYFAMEKAYSKRDATETHMARQQIENLNKIIARKRTTMSSLLEIKNSLEQEIEQTRHAKDLKRYTKVIALSNTVGTGPVKLDAITERYEPALDAIKDKQQTIMKTHRVYEHEQTDAAILQSAGEFLKQYREPQELKQEPVPVYTLRELQSIAQEEPERLPLAI